MKNIVFKQDKNVIEHEKNSWFIYHWQVLQSQHSNRNLRTIVSIREIALFGNSGVFRQDLPSDFNRKAIGIAFVKCCFQIQFHSILS